MALTAASLCLRKRGRRPGPGASAHEKEEDAQQQQHRAPRCARGTLSQKVPAGNTNVHTSRRQDRSSSCSSRSRSRSLKRKNYGTGIRRSTRKAPVSRKYATAAGEAPTASYRHYQEDRKKGECRRLHGSVAAIEIKSTYTSSTRSSSITPIKFVDIAYGSSSSNREEALAATCRDATPSSTSGSSSGGASPSTCTDRSSSSMESLGRSSRCSGREDEDDQPACDDSASRLHHGNHAPAIHGDSAAAAHATDAGPLRCSPRLYSATYPAPAQRKDALHIVEITHNTRSGSEFEEGSCDGDTAITGGERATAADGKASMNSSSRFTGRLLRKRGAAAGAMRQGDPDSFQITCRTSGRRRRTAAAAAHGKDTWWVYQEAASSYSRGTRRCRGTAADLTGAREGGGEVTGIDARPRHTNRSATEKQMTATTPEAAGKAAAACSSAYECFVSASSDLFCTTRENGQEMSSHVATTAEKKSAAAMAATADVGSLPNVDASLVQRYAGSVAATSVHLATRNSAPATTGGVNVHDGAPTASSDGVKHEGAEGCAASGMQDNTCCGAGETDAGDADASSASQISQYAALGHTCSSSHTVSSKAELLYFGDALPQQGNGLSGSPSCAGVVSNAQGSRSICGVGSNHTCSPPDSSCSSTNALLSHLWNRNNLSFNSDNRLPVGSNNSGNSVCAPCLDNRHEVALQSSGNPRSTCSNHPDMTNGSRHAHMSSNNNERCNNITTPPVTRSSNACGIVDALGVPSAGGNNSSADLLMRPGVSYYGGRQAWVAEIKYGGRRRFKVFSVAKYGYEGAKQMAAATREQWEAAREAGQLDQLMRSSQRHQCPVQSGVKGVYYDTARKGWRVVVTLNCRQMSKFFLASKFGNAEAKRLAIECRQMWLDAIRNGRADDVFEKARRLVSFKMKTTPPQPTSHSKLLSLSPVQRPMPSPSSSPSSLVHPCGNPATTAGAAFPSSATNGLAPSNLSHITLPGGPEISHVAGAPANNVTLPQGASAAASTGSISHVLLPPLVAAAAAAKVASSVQNTTSSFGSSRNSIFLLKSSAAAAEITSSSRKPDKTSNADKPVFIDAAAARLAAAVAGTAASQAQADSPATVEAAAAFRDSCSSGVATRGLITAVAGMSSVTMMTQADCAPMHAPVANLKAITAETAVQQPSVGDATWLRGTSSTSSPNVYGAVSQQQQHPSLLAHPFSTSCNGLMFSNSTSTTCSTGGTRSSHESANSSPTTRRESAHVSTCCSSDSSAPTSFVACVTEAAGLHGRERTRQGCQTSHHQGDQAAHAQISCLTAAAVAAAAAQHSPGSQKAAAEIQEAALGIEGTTTSATTAVSEEGLADASQVAQQLDCGVSAGDEAGGSVKENYASPIPWPHESTMQHQQNQMDASLGVKRANASGVRNEALSRPLRTTPERGLLMQQKHWEEASGADAGSVATTAGPSPVVRAAGEVKAETTAAAGHPVSTGSAETGCWGASMELAGGVATAVEEVGKRGGRPATRGGRTIPEDEVKGSEVVRLNSGARVPSGTLACSQSSAPFSDHVQAESSNNRHLQQHLHLQLLEDLRSSSFPLLDALWPSTAGSAPLACGLPSNVAIDLALRSEKTGISNCGNAVRAGKGQGEGGMMLLPSASCLSGRNSYEIHSLTCGAGGFATSGKADAVRMPHNSLAAIAAEKGSSNRGELPRGANVLSFFLQQPRAQLSLSQQQFLAAAAAAASASQSSAASSTAENGESSTTQPACEGAAAAAASSPDTCCKVSGELATAAGMAALRPSSPWLPGPSQRCFMPGAAGAATPSITAPGDQGRRFLSAIGNISNRLLSGGRNSLRRRGGVGSGGSVVAAAAAGPSPFSVQNRQTHVTQNAAAAPSPSVAAATVRARTSQQRQSRDGSGMNVTTSAAATGESSSTCDVRGVYLDTRNNAWAATMGVHGRNVKKSFAVAKHGYETALQLAIHARRQLERIYWGENPPGCHSSNNAPTPPVSSPPQPSTCLRIMPMPPASATSAATLAAAGTEGDEVDKNPSVTAGSPHNTSPSAAPALQLQRLQQQHQRLQQQFQQQLAATGGPPLSATPYPPLGLFGAGRDAAFGPAGFAAAVMGGTSAAAAAGLVSAAAANLQQQLRCAAALQQQQQAHNAGAPGKGGLPLVQQHFCSWNSPPLEGAAEEKGFHNSPMCESSEIASASGMGRILLNSGNSVEGDAMLVTRPNTEDGCNTVNNNAGLLDGAGAPVATGERGDLRNVTTEAAERLAAARAMVYSSLSTAPSAAPASYPPSYQGCDNSGPLSAPVDEGTEVVNGGQDGYKSSAGTRTLSAGDGPPSFASGTAPTGNIPVASTLLGSAIAGGSSSAGDASGLLLGSMQGLAGLRPYSGAAGNLRRLSPTLLLDEYRVGGGEAGTSGERDLEAGGVTAAGVAAASFLAGAGGVLLGGGAGIASLLCGGRGTSTAGETAAVASATDGPAGRNSFMMQDALTALLLQLDSRQRNDVLRGCPPSAWLAAAGAAAAASHEESSTSTALPVLLQQHNLHSNARAQHGLLRYQAVATGPNAPELHLDQRQQHVHYEQTQEERTFKHQTDQRQLPQQHPSEQRERMDCRREELQDDSGGPDRRTNGAEQHLRIASIYRRDSGESTSVRPCDQHTAFKNDAAATENAMHPYVSPKQKDTCLPRQGSSLVDEGVKAEVVRHQQQQEVGRGCVSAAGRAEGPSAGTAGRMNITGTLGSLRNSEIGSRHSSSSDRGGAGGSNLPTTEVMNTLALSQEAVQNHGQSCSGMHQPSAAANHVEGEMKTTKMNGMHDSYPWSGGVTLLETGLMLPAETKHQQPHQRSTVASTYADHAAVAASCSPLLAEDSRRA